MTAIIKKPVKKHYSSDTPTIKGIVINRDRPRGSGWCGDENCKYKSHKRFNES